MPMHIEHTIRKYITSTLEHFRCGDYFMLDAMSDAILSSMCAVKILTDNEDPTMKIGLTYDLRSDYLAMGYSEEETAEFDREETIAAIESGVRQAGYETERIGNVFALVKMLADGKRWDMVFNVAEGLYGFSREAQIPALLDAYRIPCTFSDPLVLAMALHKGIAKDLIRTTDVPTPDYLLVESADDISRIRIPFPLFAKPLAEGTSKGIDTRSVINTPVELDTICRELLVKFRQPVIVEAYLPGREVTVGIVGTGKDARVAGVLDVVLKDGAEQMVYSYKNKELCEEFVEYRLATDPQAEEAALDALTVWEKLGCRDAGRVDFRADAAGRMHFLEINPLAGMHPSHSDLPIMWQLSGRSYNDLIAVIITSALKRRLPDNVIVPTGAGNVVPIC
jgi:D-alanine-D-alanine ligase